MDDSIGDSYAFGSFVLDAAEGVLRRNGERLALPPKAVATLVALVRRAGRVVPREALRREVWPDTFVEDATLTQNIYLPRRVLGTDAAGRPVLETLPKRVYRFVALIAPPALPAAGNVTGTRSRHWSALIAAGTGLATAVVAGLATVSAPAWHRSSSATAPLIRGSRHCSAG